MGLRLLRRHADTLDKKIDQGIGHGNDVVFAAGITSFDHFVDGPQNKAFDQPK